MQRVTRADLDIRRIPNIVRPLRPPNSPVTRASPRPRHFTQNAQLLLVSSHTPRPQLPFLAQSSRGTLPVQRAGSGYNVPVQRLLSTETKKYLKEQIWLGGKYTLYVWTGIFLLAVMVFGVQQETMERRYPTPREWSFWSRMGYRNAKTAEEAEKTGTGMFGWVQAAEKFRLLLGRLENEAVDGKGVMRNTGLQAELALPVMAGVAQAGLDVEGKSYQWKRGYFETLLSAARAAEHVDGWVRDVTQNKAFPPEMVVGPSNPRPRPILPGMGSSPMEQNCIPFFEPPETYYAKILTTKGFTAKQRLTAALGYADWLDYKGLHDSAEKAYRVGLDIACSEIPNPESTVDSTTGIIRADAPSVSQNVILASTAIATHHAQNANVSSALPILLSVLRARRNAPVGSTTMSSRPSQENEGIAAGIFNFIKSWVVAPSYPPPPSSGNEPLTKTPISTCEEAGLMTYIGEILFAMSRSPESGLSWTRDAVELANAGWNDTSGKLDEDGKKICEQCLEVGLGNWKKMVAKLAREQEKKASTSVTGGKGWKGWLGGGHEDGAGEARRWVQEEKMVDEKISEMRQKKLRDEMTKHAPGMAGSFMLGAK